MRSPRGNYGIAKEKAPKGPIISTESTFVGLPKFTAVMLIDFLSKSTTQRKLMRAGRLCFTGALQASHFVRGGEAFLRGERLSLFFCA